MRQSKFMAETGYTPDELKKRHAAWSVVGVCFKIGGRYHYNYSEWVQWIESQKGLDEQPKVVTKSRSHIKANLARNASKPSPRWQTI